MLIIWKWMIQNTYLHIYNEDGWSAPRKHDSLCISKLLLCISKCSISIRPWRELGKSLISIFPGCHIQASPRSITVAKCAKWMWAPYHSFIVLMAIDISMSHAKNWEKAKHYSKPFSNFWHYIKHYIKPFFQFKH